MYDMVLFSYLYVLFSLTLYVTQDSLQLVEFLSEQVTFKCLTKGLFLSDDKAEKVTVVTIFSCTQGTF